jgi:hypothetical protein
MLDRWFAKRKFDNFRAKDAVRAPGHDSIKAALNAQRGCGIEHWVRRARLTGADAILVVVDAEEDCDTGRGHVAPPIGPALLARARSAAGAVPVGVVVASHSFESWILAHERLLAARNLIPKLSTGVPTFPENVDGIAKPKNLIRARLGGEYDERIDQPRLAAAMTYSAAALRRSRSLQKLVKELERLTTEVRQRRDAR